MAEQQQCWRVVTHARNAAGWWTVAPERYSMRAAAEQAAARACTASWRADPFGARRADQAADAEPMASAEDRTPNSERQTPSKEGGCSNAGVYPEVNGRVQVPGWLKVREGAGT